LTWALAWPNPYLFDFFLRPLVIAPQSAGHGGRTRAAAATSGASAASPQALAGVDRLRPATDMRDDTVFATQLVTSKVHATRIMAKARPDKSEQGSRHGPSDRNPVLSALHAFAFGIAPCCKEIFEHFGDAERYAAALAETSSNSQRAALARDYTVARTRLRLWQENRAPHI